MDSASLDGVKLGQPQAYVEHYDASLLYPIARAAARSQLEPVAFSGVDIWTGYELSWLDGQGKPHVAVAEFTVPAESPNIIESKSFKYYLNTFNQTQFDDWGAVREVMQADLSAVAGAAVQVRLFSLADYSAHRAQGQSMGVCLDHLPVVADTYKPHPALIKTGTEYFEGVLLSHLLKTNCPVTMQPDWASIWIGYAGQVIEPESLLAYLISYRQHDDFHEQCVETIFSDLSHIAKPESLWVYARYTRRGGLDINPFRSSKPMEPPSLFGARQ